MSCFDNHFLFSETYINDYIKINNSKNKQFESMKSTFSAIKEWHEPFVDGDYSDEDWVEEFIDLTLDVLGFKKRTDDSVRILYTNTITSDEKPIATCYVLEKNEDLNCKVKGHYYTYKAVNAAKNNSLEWVMLTNGYKWRIYNTKNVSCYENYLEVDIEESIKNLKEPDTAFKLFHLFFNSKTYYKNEDGQLEIENIKELSDKKAETIENFLRDKVEEILKDLCYGLKENMNFENYEEQDRKNIYNDAVILLFRLLFIAYAESRKLLPCSEEDKEYLKNSFFIICKDAKEILNSGRASAIKDGFEFWDRIDEYLRIYVDNTYDGGLFENFDKPILNKYKITNGYLIKCLAEMTYYMNKKTGLYNESIEYKDLSIRNLGSIYEGLLEYNLFIAKERMVIRKSKGKVTYIEASNTTLKKSDEANIIEAGGIYLSQDALERKDTGSYYTPEDVVEFIVTNTVGKKIQEIRTDLNKVLKDKKELILIEPNTSIKKSIQKEIDDITFEYIEKNILTLSIIDSAMGSGHFLVNATYNVANSIVEIICENDWINENIPTDISYWKRRVVEKCIYGIDINKLAVYLARVSLWLISASNDKALSFIDHHLKEGNSIIGTDRKHVERRESNTGTISLFDVDYMDFMGGILSKYKELSNISGNSKNEIEKQKELYKEIQQDLQLVKKKYDYYLGSQYNGGIEDKDKYALLMKSNTMKSFENNEFRGIFRIANQNKFFHWELEFPEVMIRGGFDIAIGNPPYVDVKTNDYKYSIDKTLDTRNLYSYMMEVTSYNLCKNGKLGVVVPIGSTNSSSMKSLQELLLKESSSINIATFDIRPSKIFTNVDQRVSIINVQKGNGELEVNTSKYNRWYSSERKNLFGNIKYVKNTYTKSNYGFFKIGLDIENRILKKLKNSDTKIENFIDATNDNILYYHGAVRYWIKSMNYLPYFVKNGVRQKSSEYKMISLKRNISNNSLIAVINSSLFYWYWTISSDCRHLTKDNILSFPIDLGRLTKEKANVLDKLVDELMISYKKNSEPKVVNMKSVGEIEYAEFKPQKSKIIIDNIDKVLGEFLNFTQEEVEFIVNYDIRFRVGEE